MYKSILSKKALWIVLVLLPVIVCYLLYLACTAELIVDFLGWITYSLLVSMACLALLVIIRKIDTNEYKRKKWIRVWVILVGSPVVHLFTWLYFTLIVMSFQWTKSKAGDYSITKYQSFFKAQFIYFNEKDRSDTLVITVDRNNKIKTVSTIKLGREFQVPNSRLDSNEALLKLDILKY